MARARLIACPTILRMRTKIICTIGPASETEDTLRAMMRAGMDVARLNMSHGTHEDHLRRLTLVRKLAGEERMLVAVMADLQGPKFRIGDLPKDGVNIAKGASLVLFDPGSASANAGYEAGALAIPMPHPELIAAMRAGNRVLIDDGALELRVTDNPSANGSARCMVTAGGRLLPRKGVSVPGAKVAVSSLTPKDIIDLKWAVEQGVDAVALSFVRAAADIGELRALISEQCADPANAPYIVAKIEKPEAINDFANILRVTDIVMVARGDLGVETSAQEVPFYQKQIIRDCVRAGVPVITATQMLQSMVHTPSPTRAEASDVANAVLDGTDAIMLSAESASGDYPLESVQTMQSIATRAEAEGRSGVAATTDWHMLCKQNMTGDDIGTAITVAAVEIAEDVGAKAIVCLTHSGSTARKVARLRPVMPIIALSPSARTCKFTAFMRSVQAIHMLHVTDVDAMFELAAQSMREHGFAAHGDRVVIVAGVPLGRGAGTTNLVKVQVV